MAKVIILVILVIISIVLSVLSFSLQYNKDNNDILSYEIDMVTLDKDVSILTHSNETYIMGDCTQLGKIKTLVSMIKHEGWTAVGFNPYAVHPSTVATNIDNGDVYVAGNFIGQLAYYNGTIWQVVGGGIGPFPTFISVKTNPLNVYVCGYFQSVGPNLSLPYKHVAMWDGTIWHGFPGISHVVEHMCISDNREIYVYSQDIPNFIQKWNGSSWVDVGVIQESQVRITRMIIHPTTQELYVCGEFISLAGVVMNHIARWDGINWHALDGGGVNATVEDIVFQPVTNDLYVGGAFTVSGDLPVPTAHVSVYRQNTWFALSSGLPLTCNFLASDSTGNIYMAGLFIFVDHHLIPAHHIVKWDGNNFEQLSEGLPGTIQGLEWSKSTLVAIGPFDIGTSAGIAQYDTTIENVHVTVNHERLGVVNNTPVQLMCVGETLETAKWIQLHTSE